MHKSTSGRETLRSVRIMSEYMIPNESSVVAKQLNLPFMKKIKIVKKARNHLKHVVRMNSP